MSTPQVGFLQHVEHDECHGPHGARHHLRGQQPEQQQQQQQQQ